MTMYLYSPIISQSTSYLRERRDYDAPHSNAELDVRWFLNGCADERPRTRERRYTQLSRRTANPYPRYEQTNSPLLFPVILRSALGLDIRHSGRNDSGEVDTEGQCCGSGDIHEIKRADRPQYTRGDEQDKFGRHVEF